MPTLTKALKDILRDCNADKKVSAWCESNSILSPMDFALISTTEEKIDTDLIAVAKAAGVPAESLADKIVLRKAWTLSRAAIKGDVDRRPGTLK